MLSAFVTLPFWLSIGVLSLAQGAVVAAPRALGPLPARLRSRRWALVPPAVGRRLRARSRSRRTRQRPRPDLSRARRRAAAGRRRARPARPRRAPVARAARAGAVRARVADHGGLAGEGAALALSALSCVALGALLAALTPPRWLAAGIVAMAARRHGARRLRPAAQAQQRAQRGPPRGRPAALQSAVFGSAVMGYGDLFVAGALGGLLACARRPPARRCARPRSPAALALCFDLLFLPWTSCPRPSRWPRRCSHDRRGPAAIRCTEICSGGSPAPARLGAGRAPAAR